MVIISDDIASKALSLAYSRMGQKDDQGEQARAVASALHNAIGLASLVGYISMTPEQKLATFRAPLRCEYDYGPHCNGTDIEGGKWIGNRWCCAECLAVRRGEHA